MHIHPREQLASRDRMSDALRDESCDDRSHAFCIRVDERHGEVVGGDGPRRRTEARDLVAESAIVGDDHLCIGSGGRCDDVTVLGVDARHGGTGIHVVVGVVAKRMPHVVDARLQPIRWQRRVGADQVALDLVEDLRSDDGLVEVVVEGGEQQVAHEDRNENVGIEHRHQLGHGDTSPQS